MKLVVNKKLRDNVYNVELSFIDITDTDREKISDFGEPSINVGGVVIGDVIKKEYKVIKEPLTETKTETVPLFEDDGVTPIYEDDGITQKTEEVEVVVPVLDDDGNPIMIDKVDEFGKVMYELVETEIRAVLADLCKNLKKFPSEFPVTIPFTALEYGDKSQHIAEAYIDVVKLEIENKIHELENKTDTFTGTVEFEI